MARFYSNENFPLLTVVKLRELGHEVVTALEAGNANQRISDEAVLAFAILGNRAVLTINRKHFVALHHRVDPTESFFASSMAQFPRRKKRISCC